MEYVKKTNRNDNGIRDEKGRLLPGTPALNPAGRPRRVVEAEALATLNRVWNPEELAQVAATLLAYAKAGNISAASIILSYTAGKPAEQLTIKNGGNEDELPNLSDEQIDKILADHNIDIAEQKRLANEMIDKLLIEQAKQNQNTKERDDNENSSRRF